MFLNKYSQGTYVVPRLAETPCLSFGVLKLRFSPPFCSYALVELQVDLQSVNVLHRFKWWDYVDRQIWHVKTSSKHANSPNSHSIDRVAGSLDRYKGFHKVLKQLPIAELVPITPAINEWLGVATLASPCFVWHGCMINIAAHLCYVSFRIFHDILILSSRRILFLCSLHFRPLRRILAAQKSSVK